MNRHCIPHRICTLAFRLLLVAIVAGFAFSNGQPQNAQVDFDWNPIPSSVTAIAKDDSTLWIWSDLYLYRWRNVPQGKPELLNVFTRSTEDLSRATAMYVDGSALWLGSRQGLFRLETSQLRVSQDPRIDLDAVQPERVYPAFKQVTALLKEGSTLWISANGALYRWQNAPQGEPQLIVNFPASMNVAATSLLREGPTLWIGMINWGVFRWDDVSVGRPHTMNFENQSVTSLCKIGATLFIGTMGGLYRWDDVTQGQPKFVQVGPRDGYAQISALLAQGSTVWIGTYTGLYRWEDISRGNPELIDRIEGVNTLYKDGKTVWVGAGNGLFRLEGTESVWNADIKIKNDALPAYIFTDYPLPLTWTIGNYKNRTTPQLVECRVIVFDQNGQEIQKTDWVRGRLDTTLRPLNKGSYSLIVQARDLQGQIAVSSPFRFQVYSSTAEIILFWTKSLGFLYGALTILGFAILALTSRWSQRSFEILTDPLTRKVGIYFGFALRYVPFIRIWVFERYYQVLKNEYGQERGYVPGPISRSDGSFFITADLITEIHKAPQLLVRGAPGTGKTAMVRELLRVYCNDSSLRAAKKRHGFIPIFVQLRDFGGKEITELARASLKGRGMPFAGDSFFDLLLRTGGFLIILDGLNEVSIEEEVNQFAAISPSVGLLMTSQTTLPNSRMPAYQLPMATPEFAKKLLLAFLANDEKADKLVEEVDPGLWTEIKSGYDVRLIESLVRAGRVLPGDRLKLYEATTTFAESLYDGQYPWDVLCRLAWNLWKTGQRRFQNDAQLTDSLLAPLQQAQLVVPRGDQFEFRHDLMRGYLAACWAVRHSVSIKVTQTRLEEAGIWDLSPSEQDLVFPFLTSLIETQESLRSIAQFAAQQIDQRNRLLVATQETAKVRGWQMEVRLDDQREPPQ